MNFLHIFRPKFLIFVAFILGVPVSVGVLATLTGLAAAPAVAIDVIRFDRNWVVSVDEARALIASGALTLDAREPGLRATAPLAHAQPILWQDLADRTGRLLVDDKQLTMRLRELGVEAGQPIVVLADPRRNLGEDARIVWALRSLGHPRIVMVDGGLPALLAAGLPTIQPPAGPGQFVIERRDDWTLDAAEMSARHGKGDIARLTGATALALLEADGTLMDRGRIEAVLAGQGVDRDTIVVADRGGAAATWLAAVLIDLGYDARNPVGDAEFPLTAAN